jgi:ABC-type bacteriocin/lantibiotic exporter with double-glycine peptidase domain
MGKFHITNWNKWFYAIIFTITLIVLSIVFMNGALALFVMITVLVIFDEFRSRNLKITKLEKDWHFCKFLLDETRAVLSDKQRKDVEKRIYEKRNVSVPPWYLRD